jgi:hypothetical protein
MGDTTGLRCHEFSRRLEEFHLNFERHRIVLRCMVERRILEYEGNVCGTHTDMLIPDPRIGLPLY